MKRCAKHQWAYLLPDRKTLPADRQMEYFAACFTAGYNGPNNALYCALCGATGHDVYGRRVRVHSPEYRLRIIASAKQIAEQFDIKLPI